MDRPAAKKPPASPASSQSGSFEEFQLPPAIEVALEKMGYRAPTPIQLKAIPVVLSGRDLIACSQTGTGKTAAFAIPLLARMINTPPGAKKIQVLIVAPTRELAEQIVEVLRDLTIRAQDQRLAFVIGGSTYDPQVRALLATPSFVIGTPGRLIDHLDKGNLKLEDFSCIVIDEADRLLDMGFGPQIDRLCERLPEDHQTLMFSATIAAEIRHLSQRYLKDPESITIGSRQSPKEKIRQTLARTTLEEKTARLVKEVAGLKGSMIVFTNTIGRTEKIAKVLAKAGHAVARIHGERTQNQRGQAIQDLKDGEVKILVATDVAARGIDIPQLQHVICFDLPISPEDYIHRIGRTGRAGLSGHAMTFLMPEDEAQWRIISKLMKLMPHLASAPVESPSNSAESMEVRKGTPTAPRPTGKTGLVQLRSNKTKDQKFAAPKKPKVKPSQPTCAGKSAAHPAPKPKAKQKR